MPHWVSATTPATARVRDTACLRSEQPGAYNLFATRTIRDGRGRIQPLPELWHFRITFYWAEADDAPYGFVPADMTEKLSPHLRCMKGSNEVPRRCSALRGTVGEQVACSIYENRPTPCREFSTYLEDGKPNPKCDELRATIGLPPLPLQPVPWPTAA